MVSDLRNLSFLLLFFSGCATSNIKEKVILFDSGKIHFEVVRKGALGAGQITIPIKIENENLKCLIDTGSTLSLIKPSATLRMPAKLYPVNTMDINGVIRQLNTGKVNLIEIGDFKLRNQDFAFDSNAPYECIIGLNVLSQGVMIFDFGQNHFQLKSTIDGISSWKPLKFLKEGLFAIPVSISGVIVDSIVDTGAIHSVVESEFIQVHQQGFTEMPNHLIKVEGVFSKDPKSKKFYRVTNATVAGVGLPSFAVISFRLPKNTPVINLGFSFISRVNWIFDLKNSRWALY